MSRSDSSSPSSVDTASLCAMGDAEEAESVSSSADMIDAALALTGFASSQLPHDLSKPNTPSSPPPPALADVQQIAACELATLPDATAAWPFMNPKRGAFCKARDGKDIPFLERLFYLLSFPNLELPGHPGRRLGEAIRWKDGDALIALGLPPTLPAFEIADVALLEAAVYPQYASGSFHKTAAKWGLVSPAPSSGKIASGGHDPRAAADTAASVPTTKRLSRQCLFLPSHRAGAAPALRPLPPTSTYAEVWEHVVRDLRAHVQRIKNGFASDGTVAPPSHALSLPQLQSRPPPLLPTDAPAPPAPTSGAACASGAAPAVPPAALDPTALVAKVVEAVRTVAPGAAAPHLTAEQLQQIIALSTTPAPPTVAVVGNVGAFADAASPAPPTVTARTEHARQGEKRARASSDGDGSTDDRHGVGFGGSTEARGDGGVGLRIAVWDTRALRRLNPEESPRESELHGFLRTHSHIEVLNGQDAVAAAAAPPPPPSAAADTAGAEAPSVAAKEATAVSPRMTSSFRVAGAKSATPTALPPPPSKPQPRKAPRHRISLDRAKPLIPELGVAAAPTYGMKMIARSIGRAAAASPLEPPPPTSSPTPRSASPTPAV